MRIAQIAENPSLKDAHSKYLAFNISARMHRESAVALPISLSMLETIFLVKMKR